MAKLALVSIAIAWGCLSVYHSSENQSNVLSYSILSLLILFPFLIVWSLFIYPIYFSPLLQLPQVPRVNGWKDFFNPPNAQNILDAMDTVPSEGGLVRYLDMVNTEAVFVTQPSGIAEFLQTRSDDYVRIPAFKRLLESILGKGLITAFGSEHKTQRKALAPAFTFRAIKNLYPLFWSKASEMVLLMKTQLRTESNATGKSPNTVGIDDWAGRVSLDIISDAGFGSNFDSLNNPHNSLNTSYRKGFVADASTRIVFILTLLTHPKLVRLLHMRKPREVREGVQAVTAWVKDLINQRKRDMFANVDQLEYLEKMGRNDIISAVMKSGQLSSDNLVDQAKTFLAAGHDTSAAAVTWAVYILSQPQHARIQRQLREEIRANIPGPESGVEVHAEVLDKLPYLDAVSKEVLRLYPPAHSVGRVAARDTVLCGVKIPKGTIVRALPWVTNKSKHLWGEDAREFKPGRWLVGNDKATGGAESLAYLTFGHGPKGCIGKAFAQAENKAILAALFGSFEFRSLGGKAAEAKIAFAVTAKIMGGLKVEATILEGWKITSMG